MARFHELYGLQAEQLAQLREYFERTQELLQRLRDGEVAPARLVVGDKGWHLREAPAEPPGGATGDAPVPPVRRHAKEVARAGEDDSNLRGEG